MLENKCWPVLVPLKDRESSFQHCGGTVMVIQASLGAMKHLERCFHHCGGPVKLVEACLWRDITVLSIVRVLLSVYNPVYVRE